MFDDNPCVMIRTTYARQVTVFIDSEFKDFIAELNKNTVCFFRGEPGLLGIAHNGLLFKIESKQ